MNVFIASPVYEAPEPETVTSVEATRDALRARGDYVTPWRWVRGGLVQESRNVICAEFLKEPCDILVQADTDHEWNESDVVAAIDFVASGAADVVGFAYAFRRPELAGPLGNLTSPRLLEERPIERASHSGRTYLVVGAVGAGLLVTSRRAIEALSQRARDVGGGRRAVFDIAAGTGEDMLFCRDWRALGGKVHCDLRASVGHIGRHIYRGDLELQLATLHVREQARNRVTDEKPRTRLVAADPSAPTNEPEEHQPAANDGE